MADIILHSFQSVNAVIENLDRCTKSKRCPGGKLSYYACADDDHFCRRDTGNPSKQNTFTMIGRAQVLGCYQHYRAACNLTHTSNDRVSTTIIFKVLK